MPLVSDILAALERIAPAANAYPEDSIGLQVGSPGAEVCKVATSLDRSLAAVRFARDRGAQMLVSHHPLIWDPLSAVREDDYVGRTIGELIRSGIAFAAAHTNWDAAPGGVNDVLCDLLGLSDVRPFGAATPVEQLHVVTYVPQGDLQGVIDALAAEGAGVIGLYRRCAFYSPGTGTYVPLDGSDPVIGTVGQTEETQEVRLEMVVPALNVARASEALRRAHPYDEPAFHLHKLLAREGQAIGRIGELTLPLSLNALTMAVDASLDTRSLAWGDSSQEIRVVAAVGGSGGSMWEAARDAGAGALVTGEVAQHHGLEASESGFCLIQAGHYATENPGARRLAERLAVEIPEVDFVHFEPAAGLSGRPG